MTLKKDNTYLKYYRLKAVSGDCAAGGMSKKGAFLKIPKKHFNLIKEYLRNQLERELYSVDQDIYKDAFGKLIKKHNDIGNKLIDLKVFDHKWHNRSRIIIKKIKRLVMFYNCKSFFMFKYDINFKKNKSRTNKNVSCET